MPADQFAPPVASTRAVGPVSPAGVVAGAGRRLAFVVLAIPFAAVDLAILVVGWSSVAATAITPLVVPVLMAFGWTVRTAGGVEAIVAERLLGGPVGRARPPAVARGFWRQAGRVLGDRSFWSTQSYLAQRFVLGLPLAVVEISLLGSGLGLMASPVYYRWIPQDGHWHGLDVGLWHADSFERTLPLVPVGALLVVGSLVLLHVLTAGARRAAVRMLGPSRPGAAGMAPASPPPPRMEGVGTAANRRLALLIHATVVAALAALTVTVWTATTRAYFWPVWVILSTALALAVHAWIVHVIDRPDGWRGRRFTRALAVHGGIAVLVELFLVGVWIASGRGYFWPVWSLVGLATPVTIHTLVVLSRGTSRAEQQRSSAVQVQEHDLRRIERDLHDGAQARLVALGMNLGMAEQKLDTDPAAAKALVNEARTGVGEALRELRELVRGVRPPMLADRGLGDAITALVDRQPLPVGVSVDVVPRPPDAVETAAYFVVAEALANAGKHAGAGRIDVHLQRRGTMLHVEVIDDGHGGADPTGAGLTGLRQRVEAVKGTFTVSSPMGGPTVIRAELPCGP